MSQPNLKISLIVVGSHTTNGRIEVVKEHGKEGSAICEDRSEWRMSSAKKKLKSGNNWNGGT